ncbi:MAG: SIMPL domain-containing protein [Pseudomonadota bacterium]
MRSFWIGLALCCVAAGASLAEEDIRRIVVTGEGTATAVPDMAQVSVGVTREARLAGQAMADASAAVAAVVDALRAEGIAERDLQTASIGLTPSYQHSNDGRPARVVGYMASSTLSVRVRDLDALGGVLNAVVSDGATALHNLSLGLSDMDALEVLAQADAVRDAAVKAGALAEAAGVTIGPVMSIVEAGAIAAPMPMMRGAMMEAAVDMPVAAGELSVTRRVTVTYAIAE